MDVIWARVHGALERDYYPPIRVLYDLNEE